MLHRQEKQMAYNLSHYNFLLDMIVRILQLSSPCNRHGSVVELQALHLADTDANMNLVFKASKTVEAH
jgi:hypothetical protein